MYKLIASLFDRTYPQNNNNKKIGFPYQKLPSYEIKLFNFCGCHNFLHQDHSVFRKFYPTYAVQQVKFAVFLSRGDVFGGVPLLWALSKGDHTDTDMN